MCFYFVGAVSVHPLWPETLHYIFLTNIWQHNSKHDQNLIYMFTVRFQNHLTIGYFVCFFYSDVKNNLEKSATFMLKIYGILKWKTCKNFLSYKIFTSRCQNVLQMLRNLKLLGT